MRLRLTDAGILAMIVCGATVWLLIARPRMRPENNWPLIYWAAMFAYITTAGEYVDAGFVYAGIVLSLLIRFEFMSQMFLRVLRLLEAGCLMLIIWRTAEFFLIF